MKLKDHPILTKIHYNITAKMSQMWVVNELLIAQVEHENGEKFDCIYCTILRNAVLFTCIGFIFGFLFGWLV